MENSFKRDAAFGLQTDIDDGEIVFDRDDRSGDDGAFGGRAAHEALFQHRGEIVAAGGGHGFPDGRGVCVAGH